MRDQPEEKKVKIWEPVLRFITKNPLISIWNAILFCGGAVLLFYHATISHLPDFSLPDLAGLLASVTIVGLFLVLFLTSACLLPAGGLKWVDALTKDLGTGDRSFESNKDRWLLLLFPMISWGLMLGVPSVISLSQEKQDEYLPFVLFALFIISVIASVLVGASDQSESSGKRVLIQHARRGTALFFWTILFVLPIDMINSLAKTGEVNRQLLVLATGTILFVLINGVAYFFTKVKDWVGVLAVGTLLIVLVLPLIAGNAIVWPQFIVRSLSLGEKNLAEIVVSDRQCKAFAKFGITCPMDMKGEGQIALRNVNLMSRVGTSFLIEVLASSASKETAGPTLRTEDLETYCPGSAGDLCSKCDRFVGFGALPQTGRGKLLDNYRKNLVCIQMTIPKDQIFSISWSGSRIYRGFTSVSVQK